MYKLDEFRKKLQSLDLEVHIVLGSTFGDEGKGVTTQWLAKRAISEGKRPCVIRFSGGPQAGHTILEGGVKHICSSFGSGVLLGIPTYIAAGTNTFIDPISMKMEKDDLVKKLGKEVEYPWWDLFGPRIITPMDVLAGRNDSKVLSDGTCGKGIYSTWKRYKNNVGCGINSMCSVADLKNGKYWDDILKYYGQVDESNYKDLFMEAATDIVGDENANRCMTPDKNNHYCFSLSLFMQNYDVLIFEGSQGLLLDMDCGFYPNVTPSKTGLNGIPKTIFGDSPLSMSQVNVWLVTRTYTTRHGNGYTPITDKDFSNYIKIDSAGETNVDNEFQGKFKTGYLNLDLLDKSIQRHRLDNYKDMYRLKMNCVMTHLDCLVSDKIPVITEGRLSTLESPAEIMKTCPIIDKVYTNSSNESKIVEV